MKILVFGATGFVGGRLVPHLAARGHEVTVATRSAAVFPGEVLTILADPMKPGVWSGAVENSDAVVNLAGAPITLRWNRANRKEILESRATGTRNIVEAMRRGPAKTLLCAGATGYYGHGGDLVLTEASPRGQGFLSDVTAAWQDEAMRAETFGHRVVIPRMGVVLGHGGMLARLRPFFSLGLGGRLGSGRQWFPWIHIQDLIRVIAFLLENPKAQGVFNTCAPAPVTNAEFTRTLSRILRRPALLPVPASILRLFMGEQADLLLNSQRCIPTHLESMHFQFTFPELRPALENLFLT